MTLDIRRLTVTIAALEVRCLKKIILFGMNCDIEAFMLVDVLRSDIN